MFRYESEMIPVLAENLSKAFQTKHITTEFSTGNGVADLVFTTEINKVNLFFNDYGLVALFVNIFQKNKTLSTELLYKKASNKNLLKKLLNCLEDDKFITFDGDRIICNRKYKAHTQNLFSVEAKLKDWKSGFYQALRYKFFSHKSYLAYPEQYIHRVDLNLLKEHNIGLIAVKKNGINFIYKPKTEKPQDIISYYFLSEMFVRDIEKKSYV